MTINRVGRRQRAAVRLVVKVYTGGLETALFQKLGAGEVERLSDPEDDVQGSHVFSAFQLAFVSSADFRQLSQFCLTQSPLFPLRAEELAERLLELDGLAGHAQRITQQGPPRIYNSSCYFRLAFWLFCGRTLSP